MNKIYAFLVFSLSVLMAGAAEVADVFSASTLTIAETYVEQEVKLNSDAVYLVTLKDEGNGPQCKAGSSGIVTTVSPGKAARVEVTWGSKSNEGIEVYGQHIPYGASNAVIGGTLLGTIEFTAGTTASLDIEGDWEYIGITTTAVKGKAAQFGSLTITWATDDEAVTEACEGVIINEVCGDDGTSDGTEDWVEIYNPTASAIDISDVYLRKTDEDGISEVLYTFPQGTTIEAGAYVVVEKGTHFTAGLSNNKNLTVTLVSPMDRVISLFDKVLSFTHNGSHPAGGSYSLCDDGWMITDLASKGEANLPHSPLQDLSAWYTPVTAATLADGIDVVLVNREYGYAMSYNWNTTKDASVYMNAYPAVKETTGDNILIDVVNDQLAVVQLIDGGDGTWAIKFGETNNYLNDSRYMACVEFKDIDFKKKDDATKGTRATITFDANGDADIDFADGGVIKFNYKDDGSSRFFNYDPTDKPEEHLSVTLYTLSASSSIQSVDTDTQSAPIYYNLQGIRVANPTTGIYIRIKGDRATKVIL